MQPGKGSRRQPSGSGLNFPYGDRLNRRTTKRLKRTKSRRATKALMLYSELAGIIADKILA
jgi:hypothetical protein